MKQLFTAVWLGLSVSTNAQSDIELLNTDRNNQTVTLTLNGKTNVTELTPFEIDPSICRIGDPIYFDISGRQVLAGNLSQGIYIMVEFWDNGSITSRKVFIEQ